MYNLFATLYAIRVGLTKDWAERVPGPFPFYPIRIACKNLRLLCLHNLASESRLPQQISEARR